MIFSGEEGSQVKNLVNIQIYSFVSCEAIEIIINGMGFRQRKTWWPGQSEVWNENRVNVAK